MDFFGKFVTYEDRHTNIKVRDRTHKLLSHYLGKFRANSSLLANRERAA